MSLPNIEEILKKVKEVEEKLSSATATTPPTPPSASPPPSSPSSPSASSSAGSTAVSSGRGVRSKAYRLLEELCQAMGGKLFVPPKHPDRPLCLLSNIYEVSVDYDPKENADIVKIGKFRGVEYRQVGKYRRKEIVLDIGTLKIVPQRSIKFEVDLYATTRNPKMPSLYETFGNWYSTIEISKRYRNITPERTMSLACTAVDTSREHKIACILFPGPEVPYKFEFNEKTKQWQLIAGRRRLNIFKGL